MPITKEELLKHNRHVSLWVHSLNELSEEKWRKPIAENKWTVAEIISHLSAWDLYIIEHRLAIENEDFPISPIVEKFNTTAAEYARNHSKETILNEFAVNRQKLIECIENIDVQKLQTPFYRNLTILQYLGGFIEHDLHHQKQILDVI
ncbi:DinB family protein [Gottfriedia solisilvae]|uniref:DinB-like domain-containing protein n=1 Tax=Gottfriedia solisilvae TaxID=1516104 RepID=A0A8J3AQV3_9BACI|nr:DinB family protein [Gottfriedia solisilvae]GGI15242.1 hypothetical protein GCM10007380_26990 [Gottfriedia solisilvae]